MQSWNKCIQRQRNTKSKVMPQKELKKLIKTERAFLLEKLVERKYVIKGADVLDFQD